MKRKFVATLRRHRRRRRRRRTAVHTRTVAAKARASDKEGEELESFARDSPRINRHWPSPNGISHRPAVVASTQQLPLAFETKENTHTQGEEQNEFHGEDHRFVRYRGGGPGPAGQERILAGHQHGRDGRTD